MKNILIHSIAFSPDGVSTAYLYNDIAQKFKTSGYNVTVLTTTPHYNIIPSEIQKQPLIAKLGGIYYESYFKDIRVIHIPQKKFKSAILRIIGFVYWHFLSVIIGLLQRKVDIILSPSPPLTIGVVNLIIGKLKGAKVIYNVQEIYPDFLVNQGGLKFKPIINFLKWMEKIVYNNSHAVTTIDPIFYKAIVGRFKNPSKLRIIPNFVDNELFQPQSIDQIEINRKLFPEKSDVLKVMYAGNIGHAQDWEPLVEVAKRLRSDKIEFWVIGEGVMKDHLANSITTNNLTNVHLISYQPKTHMPKLLAYADLHFIFMSPAMEGEGFPSKVYTIMACSKPLLVISGKNTPIHNFLEPLDCAFLIDGFDQAEKIDKLEHILKEASNKDLVKIGANGYDLIQKEYAKVVVTQKYVDLCDELLNN